MKDRKTLRQMAIDASEIRLEISGQPADKCPYCGSRMFADRTTRLETRTIRYVYCRNANCGKRFVSRQMNAVIVREVGE